MNAKYFLITVVIVFIFCVLSSLFFFNRGFYFPQRVQATEFEKNAGICNDLPFCFRVGGAWIGSGVGAVVDGALKPFLFKKDPDQAKIYTHFLGSFLYRLLWLTPLLLVIALRSSSMLARFFLGGALFLAGMGWGLANREWPWGHDYNFYIFGMNLNFADYHAIGFVFLLMYVLFQYRINMLAYIGLITLGQLGFENLGVVTVVAVTVNHLLSDHPQKYKLAAQYFFVGILYSMLLGAAVFGLIYFTHQGQVSWAQAGKGFDYVYETYGKHNFDQMTYIRKAFFRMMAFPALTGLIGGLLVIGRHIISRDNNLLSQENVWHRSTLSVWIGFLSTCGVGLFVSGIRSEMGRQFLPLALMTVLLFFGLTIWCYRQWVLKEKIPSQS